MNNSNIYKQGFCDGMRYAEMYFSDKDDNTSYLIGSGVGALTGLGVANSRSSNHIENLSKLEGELDEHKKSLSDLERRLSRVNKSKGLEAELRDFFDFFGTGSKKNRDIADIKSGRSEVSRMKAMVERKKNEISEVEKKMRPLRDKIKNNRWAGAGIGLGAGLAGTAAYNLLKGNKDKE